VIFQLKINRDKLFLRHVFLHYFDLKKTAVDRLLSEMYGDETLSERTCRVWFELFRNSDFDIRDKERPGQPKKFEDFELEELHQENLAQTFSELSKPLNITPKAVSKRRHAMGRFIRKRYGYQPHELSENAILNCLSIATSLLAR